MGHWEQTGLVVWDESECVEFAAEIKEWNGAAEEDVAAFCKDKISWFKIPKYVHFLDVFPMTASQKIQKYKLREMAHELWPDA